MTERLLPGQLRQKLARLQHLMIRIPLGVIFIAHGGQNLFGWWGGAGFAASLQSYQAHLGVPVSLAALALLTQFFGGILVLIGLLTRWAALALAILMGYAIFAVHLGNGFFLNWGLTSGQGHGMEFSLALLGMSLMLVCSGPGILAVERAD